MSLWVKAGGRVELKVRFWDFDGARPGQVEVEYIVYDRDTGVELYDNIKDFKNEAGAVFERVSFDGIKSYFSK